MTTAAITSISETTTTTETSVVTESFQEILSSAINSPVKETDKLEIIISAVGNKAKDMLPSLGTAALTLFNRNINHKIYFKNF